ncbi:hemerythrin domain-containing protein [Microlunatus panaciterrae]|uniref:Hemerythrin-like domain-containing protein n=1 Tax=Microlunatus panaciterrae TaxID=400768 RepID=A0ABS2RF98_9ACTN|nr:hemerythrin domain-containing protein [Microlunatus panaciterrae]MBM7797202.1 hemerythrin-like domain-containing protein [Microlunatus panaciterrae]
MCEYCGCREVEPIARLMDEHLRLLELGDNVIRAIQHDDPTTAATELSEFSSLLTRHVDVEERGVFAAMKDEGEFVEAIEELEQEHRDLDVTVAGLLLQRPDFADEMRTLMHDLSDHIDKENLGIFPMAVVSLRPAGWRIVEQAASA